MRLARFVFPLFFVAVRVIGQSVPDHTLSISTLALKIPTMRLMSAGDANLRSSTAALSSEIAPDATAQLSPASVDFGTQTINSQIKEGILMILTNTGNVVLNVDSISITGADSGDFWVEGTCRSIQPGLSCNLAAGFTPTAIGRRTAAISVSDNASNSPQIAKLEGVGTYIQLPSRLDFANQVVGTTSLPGNITLTNKGSVAVHITKISLTGADPRDFSEINNCGATLAAGATCSITVTFTPTMTGDRSADVSVYDNGGGSPQKVSLNGTGT
jgi:Abnormal spindle-like microcephaly-assoc'd, ASPM-SPD-2-Hydin